MKFLNIFVNQIRLEGGITMGILYVGSFYFISLIEIVCTLKIIRNNNNHQVSKENSKVI